MPSQGLLWVVSALLNYSCPKEALTSKSTGLVNSINLILLHLELETAAVFEEKNAYSQCIYCLNSYEINSKMITLATL